MLGLNEIKSEVNLSTTTIFALCESMVARIEEADMRRLKATDQDRYLRSLKAQFKQLDDRYPAIFNILLEYGRRTPDGFNTLDRIKKMLQAYDVWQAADEEKKKQVEVAMEYPYAEAYVRPAVGPAIFDPIVKKPDESILRNE